MIKTNTYSKLPIAKSISAAVAAMILSPLALSDDSLAIEEIVVTAQKRAENVQDVPVSVSAIGAETIQAMGIQNTADLTKISPSLTVVESNNKTNSAFSIRGIGTNTFGIGIEQAVALIVDDVAMVQQGQGLTSLVDIEHIEVLRGPQSTLFGKSASGGVISVTTKKPSDEFSGSFEIDVTDDESYRTMASFSGPINDELSYRLTTHWRDLDGYIENLTPGQDDLNGEEGKGINGKLYWDISDSLSLAINAYYNKEESECCVRQLSYIEEGVEYFGIPGLTDLLTAGYTPSDDNTKTRLDHLPNSENTSKGMSLRASIDIGDFELLSITSYDEWEYFNSEDVDFGDLDMYAIFTMGALNGGFYSDSYRNNEFFSQEFRLVSPNYDNYDYLVGFYYSDSEIDREFFRDHPLAPSDYTAKSSNQNTALFGQFNWHFSEATTVGLGLRYLEEEIEGERTDALMPTVSGSADDEEVVGKVFIKHNFQDDLMVFASYTRGYKGQAYDLSGGFDASDADNPVAPEIADAYEFGLKSNLFDKRVQLNLTAFYTEYDDFQVQGVDNSGPVTEFNLGNVGVLETQGVELESVARLTESLTLSFNAAYTDATVNDYTGPCYIGQTVAQGCEIVSGAPAQTVDGGVLPSAPEWKFSATLDYQKSLDAMPFDFFANVNYTWQDDIQFGIDQNPVTTHDDYGVTNLRLGVVDKDGRYELTAYVNNVFDENYAGVIGDTSLVFPGGAGTALGRVAPRNAMRYAGIKAKINF
ncbi:TonB-dependent receptor [Maricurvus nonylphenolicus]|uniref:TonB-dependent receptor n=1 Tax=Maricurvus nonylphenolicus TaxID=1008307 RepID=UPI0036F1F8C2